MSFSLPPVSAPSNCYGAYSCLRSDIWCSCVCTLMPRTMAGVCRRGDYAAFCPTVHRRSRKPIGLFCDSMLIALTIDNFEQIIQCPSSFDLDKQTQRDSPRNSIDFLHFNPVMVINLERRVTALSTIPA